MRYWLHLPNKIGKHEAMLSPFQSDPRAKGERQKVYRSRKVRWPFKSLVTDGKGNITSRPLTKNLRCFADPVEWLMGRGDELRRWGKSNPQPKGCAGCPVSASCAKVAWERIQSVTEVAIAHDRWEIASCQLDYKQRYETSEWEVLVFEINRQEWLDPNDDNLLKDRERQQKASRKLRQKRTKPTTNKAFQPKSVPKKIRSAIQAYRDDRVREMLTRQKESDPPLVIRNRSEDRLILIGDSWQARETLEREGRPSSGRAVFERLEADNKIPAGSPKSMIKRVEEALKQAAKFIDDEDWPFFDPLRETQPKPFGYGMHPDAVTVLIDDAE